MRYLFLYSPTKQTPATPEHMAEMGKFIDDLTKSGIFISTGGFAPSKDDGRVRLDNGEFTVTDGPFTEAKEIIAGFALLELRDKEHAIEVTKRFLKIAGDGVSEFHPLYG